MNRFTKFSIRFLENMFPDDPKRLKPKKSPHASKALILGHKCAEKILRHVYYDLSRNAPRKDVSTEAAMDPLLQLSAQHLHHVLRVQQGLSLVWDDIASIFQRKCDSASEADVKCGRVLWPRYFFEAKARYPFDPIFGIQKLLKTKLSSMGYCKGCSTEIQDLLQKRPAAIWDDLNEWISTSAREDSGSGSSSEKD